MAVQTLLLLAILMPCTAVWAAEGTQNSGQSRVGDAVLVRQFEPAEELREAFLNSPDILDRWRELVRRSSELTDRDLAAPGHVELVADSLLLEYPGDLAAHQLHLYVCEETGDAACAAFHRGILRAQIDAIRASGDGSRARPYHVVSDAEAMKFLELENHLALGSIFSSMGESLELLVFATDRSASTVASADAPAGMKTFYFDLSDTYRAVRRLDTSGVPYSARQLIWELARRGNPSAQASVGTALLMVSADTRLDEAIRWLERANAHGNWVAHVELSRAFGDGSAFHLPPDFMESFFAAAQDRLATVSRLPIMDRPLQR